VERDSQEPEIPADPASPKLADTTKANRTGMEVVMEELRMESADQVRTFLHDAEGEFGDGSNERVSTPKVHALLRFLARHGSEQGEGMQTAYSLDDWNTDSIDQWTEGKRDFVTHVLTQAASPDAQWAQGMDGEKLLVFQQKALLHLSRRLRKIGDAQGALEAIGRRKIILDHIPNAERDTAMVAWEMAIFRRDNQKDFPGARKDFDDSVQLAKKGGDKVGAIFNEFNLRQMEIVETEATMREKALNAGLLHATFHAIASLRDLMEKVGTTEPKRVAALVPNMITELAKVQTILGNTELASAFVEELKQQERVKKSLDEPGDTIWKKIVSDLEQGIARIA